MRKISIIEFFVLCVSLFFLSGSSLSFADTRIQQAVDSDLSVEAFGPRVAGSYLLYVSHVGFPTIPALVNLTRDGGFISSDASDFGAANTTLNTPVYGAWKKKGTRKIAARTLYIAFNKDGVPVALTRSTGDFTFTKDFKSGSGQLLIEQFNIDQDPLDPTQQPFATLTATFTAKRITVP